jgi:thiamine-monophosphate kinase
MKRRESATGRIRLGELGEDRLLERLLPLLSDGRGVICSAGDDCAVVEPPRGGNLLLLKTDCVVEKIHFLPSTDPVSVGWKAMMRPLSDFAAMSGLPRFALITLIVSAQRSSDWVTKLYRGLKRAAARFDVNVVGGETSNTRGPAAVSVSVAGFVEKKRWVSRSGGKPGDDLFVTGRLGGALRSRHLRFVPRIEESRWLTSNFGIHAMIDLSDGLGADLPRLARSSRVRFKIEMERLPLARGVRTQNAIADGEDYELLFAVSPRERRRLQTSWHRKFPKLPLTRIGSLVPQSARSSPAAADNQQLKSGYIHFK